MLSSGPLSSYILPRCRYTGGTHTRRDHQRRPVRESFTEQCSFLGQSDGHNIIQPCKEEHGISGVPDGRDRMSIEWGLSISIPTCTTCSRYATDLSIINGSNNLYRDRGLKPSVMPVHTFPTPIQQLSATPHLVGLYQGKCGYFY